MFSNCNSLPTSKFQKMINFKENSDEEDNNYIDYK